MTYIMLCSILNKASEIVEALAKELYDQVGIYSLIGFAHPDSKDPNIMKSKWLVLVCMIEGRVLTSIRGKVARR